MFFVRFLEKNLLKFDPLEDVVLGLINLSILLGLSIELKNDEMVQY